MKIYIVLPVLLLFIACHKGQNSNNQTNEVSPNNDQLVGRDNDTATDAAIFTEFNTTLLEIQSNLDEIMLKEKMISLNTQDPELRKSKKDQILSDIQLIYSRMNQNKQSIAALNKKLNDANGRIDSLKETIANLDFQLRRKKEDFNELNAHLAKISPEYLGLLSMYQEDKQEVDLKTETLNTAYYSIGTFKELEDKGIITKEGGFIGIGQRMELNKNFNQKKFTRINTTVVMDIPLDRVNKVTIVTPHPSDSYEFIQDPFYTKLVIIDAVKFWSVSKFLVLVVEK